MSDVVAGRAGELPWPGVIGLCLSGGGYRATVFHLGVLSYLERIDRLHNVQMVSAVSGATFTICSYALSLVEDKPYNDFFRDFYTTLEELNLADVALDELADIDTQRPSGRENLILAMSDVYARKFYSDPSGQPYRFSAILERDMHMKELVLNALDFRRAESFLFQRSEASDIPVGNRSLPVRGADAGAIRVADIVATCTSIPAAFEPLEFPDDFEWPDGKVPPATRELFSDGEGNPRPVPLMDGGLHDNQGIDSLLLADERHPEDLDLFVLSDVFREPEEHYRMPEKRGLGGPSLGTLATLAWLMFFACAITGTAIAVQAVHLAAAGEYELVWHSIIYIGPLIMNVVVMVLLWWIRATMVNVLLPRVPQIGVRSDKYIRRMKLQQVVEMVDIRLVTLVATSTTIVWKRVRNLGYRLIYGNPAYEGKRVSCLLQHLRPGEPVIDLPGLPPPSPRLRAVAEVAGNMPTILWFDNAYQLPCVLATGEASACYNLMKHIARRHGDDPASYPDEVRALWDQLARDWQLLCDEPYALIRERAPDLELAEIPEDRGSKGSPTASAGESDAA